MVQVQSAGFLIFRRTPTKSFLLMQHANRWDLPKGHLDDGETLEQCAVRELSEETGIGPNDFVKDDNFLFRNEYHVLTKRDPQPLLKRLTIYLGFLQAECLKITPTEHLGYQWIDWAPPHSIQPQTIDPLLAAVAEHFEAYPDRAP